MELFLDNEKVNFSDIELRERYINEGSEGTLYQYGKEAIKVYKDDFYMKRLNEVEAKKLSKIPTKRILLPKRMVYNSDKEFIGYTTPFKIEYYKELLYKLSMKKYIEELELLNEDVMTLSYAGVLLEDLHQDNFMMSDGIYLCDPGLYRFTKRDPEDIYRDNVIEINYLFTVMLVELYLGLNKKQTKALRDFFKTDELFIDKLQEECEVNPDVKVKPYMKKLAMSLL